MASKKINQIKYVKGTPFGYFNLCLFFWFLRDHDGLPDLGMSFWTYSKNL